MGEANCIALYTTKRSHIVTVDLSVDLSVAV